MILFHTVHAINVKAWPLKDYEFITEMDIMKRLEIPGEKCKTIHSCKAFTQAIADVEGKKIQN